jgi:hypothetical protein
MHLRPCLKLELIVIYHEDRGPLFFSLVVDTSSQRCWKSNCEVTLVQVGHSAS